MPGETGETRQFPSAFDQKQLAFHPSGEWLLVLGGRRMQRLDLESGEFTPIPFEARFEVAEDPGEDVLIRNVRLFDGTGDEAVPGSSVLVRDGRIAGVWTGEDDEVPAAGPGTTVIDGGGRMLLPGLMDNHYHYWQPLAGADLLAAGITAIRDPGSAIQDAMDFKDAVRLGVLAGPDVYTAGPLIDGPAGYHPLVDVSIDDPAAAPALVRRAEGAGRRPAQGVLPPRPGRACGRRGGGARAGAAGHRPHRGPHELAGGDRSRHQRVQPHPRMARLPPA